MTEGLFLFYSEQASASTVPIKLRPVLDFHFLLLKGRVALLLSLVPTEALGNQPTASFRENARLPGLKLHLMPFHRQNSGGWCSKYCPPHLSKGEGNAKCF